MSTPERIFSQAPADEQAHLQQIYKEKEELQLRFDTLRLIINTAGVGIIAVDEHQRIVDSNHTLARMFGYSIQELKGKDVTILLPTNIFAKHEQHVQELSKLKPSVLVGNTRQNPLHGTHRTNGPFPVEIAISSIQVGGSLIYTGIVHDRTATDRLERDFEHQTKILRNRVRELEAFQELSKLGAEDDIDGIISRFIVDVVPKSTEHPDKTVTIIELEGRTYRNTKIQPVVKLTAPLLDGRLTFGFTEEIPFHSESKQDLLNAYASELGEIIKRRKAENSMMQTKRWAAMSALGASGAGHRDKRRHSPTNIRGVVVEPAFPKDSKEPLRKNHIQPPVPAGRGLPQREECSLSMGELSVFDLGEVVLEHLSATEKTLILEGFRRGVIISFNTNCAADSLVTGLPNEITLIVQELIKNGADACIEDGEIDIDIQAQHEYVLLRVSDTGKGMDEVTQKRIFDPYFITKDNKPGHGVTLSAAQKIAREHGGEISVVNSQLGQGTIMELRLPRARQHEQQKSPGEMNILWAEDDDIVRMVAQEMTQNLNHNITFVNNGQHALEMLGSNTYDLLITDMSMPRMSGWQLLKIIQGRYTHMQRAIASGYVVNQHDLKQHGANYFLSKPLELENLVAVFDKVAQG